MKNNTKYNWQGNFWENNKTGKLGRIFFFNEGSKNVYYMCVKINMKKMYREDTYKNYRQIYGQIW